MDYSIHDAIEAGFNHVVFIIRKDIEMEFKEVIGERIKATYSAHDVTVDYAFQDINDIPSTLPEGRTKPWGTGQDVLAAKKVLDTPFIVIDADDYYGKEGFKAVHEYLVNQRGWERLVQAICIRSFFGLACVQRTVDRQAVWTELQKFTRLFLKAVISNS